LSTSHRYPLGAITKGIVMNKRARRLVAVLMVFGLGLGMATAVVISAVRTIQAVDYMGLA
ncbi:MAG: hypothetical protein ACREFB_20705, partial [Stellaceae bacterium]